MADVNTILICGRLGRDPETKEYAAGKSLAKFSVATERSVRTAGGDWDSITDWHNVVCFGPLAERVGRTVGKGDKVFVEGGLRMNKWQDEAGKNRVSAEIVAHKLHMVQRKRNLSEQPPKAVQPSAEDVEAVPF